MNASIATDLIESIIAKLRQLGDSGSHTLDDGTVLLRKLPPRVDGLFSEAFSHEIFASLTNDLIDHLEASVRLRLPADLREFYRQANGIDLFFGSLSISGLREDYSRRAPIRLPISLEYGNVIDRPHGMLQSASSQVRFGFFSADPGAEVAMNLDGDRCVYAYPRYELGPTLYKWPDLETFLRSEVDRMTSVFKARNGNVDPLNPIEPPWQ